MSKYNVVRVGNVEPINKSLHHKKTFTAQEHLLTNRCKCSFEIKCEKKCKCKTLAYYQNSDIVFNCHNSFYRAFANAYNNHKDIIISPDDVWFMIMLQFKKYINSHSEEMRHFFVSHKGKQKLTVTTSIDLEESEWNEFFNEIIEQIKLNTNNNIVEKLQSNFTTTGMVEKMLSTAVIMDSFQNYFDYIRCIPMCGIRNVLFMGTLDDWKKLLTKLFYLKTYAVDKFWTHYIDELKPIIEKFIDTYQGNVDMEFWNTVMNIEHGRLGSGSTTKISGWILKFYGIYNTVDDSDIVDELIDVPIELDNKLTGIKKNINIYGGFGGIYNDVGQVEQVMKIKQSGNTNIINKILNIFTSTEENKTELVNIEYDAYKPQMSFIVYHDGKEELIY